MMDLMSDSAWIKANSLIKEKYGKNLSYRAIKLLKDRDLSVNEVFYSSGDDLVIPLKLKDYNLGDVIVSRGSVLSHEQKSEITDLVKFLVEPKIYSLQLKKSEENLLKAGRQSLAIVEDEGSLVALYSAEKQVRKTLSQIILLKSHTELTRNKVALKIHEMTERNLFVHLDDIAGSLKCAEDFESMSDITIYIPDIETVSLETLALLAQNITGDTGPLILAGSSLTMEAIESKPWPASIKKDLMGFYFDIDRVPLSQQTSVEILDLLFFELDSIMT